MGNMPTLNMLTMMVMKTETCSGINMAPLGS